ncbi:hypothetical protein EV1_012509 [Malus domestica]
MTEEVVTQGQQFMKSMEVSGPSKLVIEEISSLDGDVGSTPLKPIRYRGLLAIKRPKVDDCCTFQLVQTCVIEVGERTTYYGNGQKEKNGEGPNENKGKYIAGVGEEDVEVEERDIEVGEGDVREGDTEVFFDVPISFEGNVE